MLAMLLACAQDIGLQRLIYSALGSTQLQGRVATLGQKNQLSLEVEEYESVTWIGTMADAAAAKMSALFSVVPCLPCLLDPRTPKISNWLQIVMR